MRRGQALVDRIGGLGDGAYRVHQLDLLQVVRKDRVLEPQLAARLGVGEASDGALGRDRAGGERQLVAEVNVNQHGGRDDEHAGALQVVHRGDEDPRGAGRAVQAPDRIVHEALRLEPTAGALADDGYPLLGPAADVDVGHARLARIHAADAHVQARALIGGQPADRPDRDGGLLLRERVAAEDRLLRHQGTAVVAQAAEHEAVVLEQDSRGQGAGELRHRQNLRAGHDHRLRRIGRIGGDVDAHRHAGVADPAAPGRIARILLDERALEGAAHGGDGAGELFFGHDHLVGRAKAVATSAALRGRETMERVRRAP